MIFVTVGTHYQGFERLIKAVDDLARKGINEKLYVQIGYSTYIPKNCEWSRFIDPKKILDYYRNASIVITHGGIGSIMQSLDLNKKTIVVPRLKKFGEHTDDHQLQIVRELERQGRIIAVYDIKHLERAIKLAKKWRPKKSKKNDRILSLIEDFIKKHLSDE